MLVNNSTVLSRHEALEIFKHLVNKYGTKWNILVPSEAHIQLAQCNKVLTRQDKDNILEELQLSAPR